MTDTAVADTTQTVPLPALVTDYAVYPRHAVDPHYVSRLAETLRAGHQLPPPVVDADTMRIVDGWHRVDAQRRIVGASGSIDVILRHFESEAELLATAVSLNIAHGRRLDRQDLARSVLLLSQAGVATREVAAILHTREESVRKLTVRVAYGPEGGAGSVPGMRTIVLKRPMAHMEGMELTEEQARAHMSMPGTSFLLPVRQIITALRADLMNRDDEHLQDALVELADALGTYLQPALPPAAATQE